jgi:hypothetical protein
MHMGVFVHDIEMTKMSDVEFIGRNKEYRFNCRPWRLTLILEYELFSLLMTLSWLWIVKHQLKALLLCFNVYLTVKLDKNSHVHLHLYPFLLQWMQCEVRVIIFNRPISDYPSES